MLRSLAINKSFLQVVKKQMYEEKQRHIAQGLRYGEIILMLGVSSMVQSLPQAPPHLIPKIHHVIIKTPLQ